MPTMKEFVMDIIKEAILAEEREKAKEECRKEVARNLLKMGNSPKDIAKITGLALNTIIGL